LDGKNCRYVEEVVKILQKKTFSQENFAEKTIIKPSYKFLQTKSENQQINPSF
jgi:hypothetical protein